jgi:hypothetical protein
MLAKVCPDENDWDLYLDEVTFSYRSINQKSTKTSPFQVMFGRNCFQNEEESQMDKHVSDDVDMEDWLKKMIDIRQQINVQVKENVKKSSRNTSETPQNKKKCHKRWKKMKYMRGTGFWVLMQKSLHAKDRKAKKIGKVPSLNDLCIQREL